MRAPRAVPEIHAQELRDRLEVVVVHDGFRDVNQRPAPMAPTVAQIPVFGRGEREIEVEPAQLEEIGSTTADVVAGENGGEAAGRVEVLVDEIEDQLIDAGLTVRGGAIPRGATYQCVRVSLDGPGHVPDPIRRWDAVVVGEEKDFRLAGEGSVLARPGGAGLFLVGDPEAEGWREAARVDREGFRAAVVDQQDFKPRMIQGLQAECGQASGCRLWPASAGNDDQDAQEGGRQSARRLAWESMVACSVGMRGATRLVTSAAT